MIKDTFLASVTRVYLKSDKKLDKTGDFIKKYNGNSNFDDNDIRFLGVVEFSRESAIKIEGYSWIKFMFLSYWKIGFPFPLFGDILPLYDLSFPFNGEGFPFLETDIFSFHSLIAKAFLHIIRR